MTKASEGPTGALSKLGPASQQMLIAAGIESEEQLRELGAVRAYLVVKRTSRSASLNLLWALEDALTGKHWRVVAREDRTGLLLQLDDANRSAPSKVGPRADMADRPPPRRR